MPKEVEKYLVIIHNPAVEILSVKNITLRLDETLKKQIEVNKTATYRAYVLRGLAEAKKEAIDPHTTLEGHDDFMREWKAKREARKNAL